MTHATPLRIVRWAHRGAGKVAPENTLTALREGARRGFRAVEFDTMPTADGVWVLHHDWTTGRTLRSSDPALQGLRIVQTPLSTLQSFDAGGWLGPAFAGERLPLLADALSLCDELGLQVNVELKLDIDSGVFTPDRLAQAAPSLLSVLRSSPYGAPAGADSRLVVSSFGLSGLHALRAAGYGGRLAALFEELSPDWVVPVRDLQAEAVHLHHSQVTPEVVRRIHTTRRAVRVYTVNDLDRLRVLDAMGVDACFTDDMSFADL